MATEDSLIETESARTRFPFAAAGFLLGLYVAMYLAIAGAVHVLTTPDAMAAVVHGSVAEQAADSAPASAPSAFDVIRAEAPGQPSTDAARECEPTAGVNTECLYN